VTAVAVPFRLVDEEPVVLHLIPVQWRSGWGLAFGALWLVFLAGPVASALDRHPGLAGRAATVAATVAFAALYLGLFRVAGRPGRHWLARAVLAGLVAMSTAFCLLAGEEGLFTFVYLAGVGVLILPPRAAVAWVVGLMVLTAVLPLAVSEWRFDLAIPFAVGMGALAVFGLGQVLRRNRELGAAREELTRLAVADERLRFARDLHDVLGHSLTVMALKADLAGKLTSRAPDRAHTEIAEVERLAREALTDVRATVAGYRAVSLAAEMSRARRSLEAAGIAANLPHATDDVSTDHRELFGWVIREGVTNVVRHSKARSCTVVITPTSVEVLDDGISPAGEGPEGHGLAGLRERVTRAGGRLSAGHRPGGGFQLYVEVPQ
jgi:two-component system, NarL family, sensor histidine kinase DesK